MTRLGPDYMASVAESIAMLRGAVEEMQIAKEAVERELEDARRELAVLRAERMRRLECSDG